MSKRDMQISKLDAVSWEEENRTESFENVIAYARSIAVDAYEWYAHEKKMKRRFAKLIRGVVILCTALAGIIPILTEIYTVNGKAMISPAWASVALAVAGTFVIFDRFFGLSTGWLRFVEAMMRIRMALYAFDFDCTQARLSWKGEAEQFQGVISRCRALVQQVNIIVLEETKKWDSEFRDVLGKLDEEVKSLEQTRTSEALGAVNVTIADRDKYEGDVEIVVDNGTPRVVKGASVAVTDLTIGAHVVQLRGKVAGKEVCCEKAVTVLGGEIGTVSLGIK